MDFFRYEGCIFLKQLFFSWYWQVSKRILPRTFVGKLCFSFYFGPSTWKAWHRLLCFLVETKVESYHDQRLCCLSTITLSLRTQHEEQNVHLTFPKVSSFFLIRIDDVILHFHVVHSSDLVDRRSWLGNVIGHRITKFCPIHSEDNCWPTVACRKSKIEGRFLVI